jgi:hypothetical protein
MLRSAWLFLSMVAELALVGCGPTRRSRGGDGGAAMDSGGLDLGSFDAGSVDLGGGVDAGEDFGTVVGTEGALRLGVGGLLEVFHAGVWGTVCDDDFGAEDVLVACRQLGFTSGSIVVPEVSGVDSIHMDDVMCVGTEARLIDCAFPGFGVNNCMHSEDVGLICERRAP